MIKHVFRGERGDGPVAENDQALLTVGSVPRKMLTFALPIFLSNLFQQLYNAVDSLIVGTFIGQEALAAVSSSSSLIMLLTGFINGLSLGRAYSSPGTTAPRTGTRWSAPSTPPWPWASPPGRC